jgi:hypothetical protein
MALQSAKKIILNRYTHSVRAAQAVLQYGVGAMVDFPNQTLMTAAPEFWQEQVVQIHDERLEKVLHVDYFGLPGGQDDPHFREGISYARFPEWYFCPKCRKFQPIGEWVKEYKSKAKQKQLDSDPDMVKSLRCPTCKQELVVTRIVTACECGHIDDFPWVKWVHCQNLYGAKPVCDHPTLTFKTSATSAEGLEGLTVTCENCKARATLKGAFDADRFEELEEKYEERYNFRCTGRHPWKNTKDRCGKFPKVLQRGSSSVYFPISASSLVIPPYSSLLTSKIEGSYAFEKQKNTIADLKKNPSMAAMVPQFLAGAIDGYANDISLEIGVPAAQVKVVLERKWMVGKNDEEYSTSSVKYRHEEYEALSGSVALTTDDYGDFMRESTDNAKYRIPYVSKISLIHKIREVQALTGFSRLKPVEQIGENADSEHAVSIKQKETNWYPAYEVRGEGIFIEFDEGAITEWLKKNSIMQQRVDMLNENYAKSFIGSTKPRKITAKFLLLHTISHLLIKQLSFECGYSIASLKERLYCSEESEGHEMAGILIYTASGDSEGTMGGLVRQGRYDTFPTVFKKAIESAMTCSNDPVCSLSMGQGRDSLNLSACYSCSLIPETSCEEFNIFLDRGTVVGTYENRSMGFYSEQLYNGAPWEDSSAPIPAWSQEDEPNKTIMIVDNGIDLSDALLKDVWESLREWSGNDTETQLLKDLEDQAECFNGKEVPRQDCIFRVSESPEQFKCDIIWKKSKVAFFSEDNEDGYQAAVGSDWKCFLATDPALDPNAILTEIMEK